MVTADELRELLSATPEWLLVRGSGRAFPIENHLVEINDKGQLSLLDEDGWRTWRLNRCELNGVEVAVEIIGQFGGGSETLRLIPRTSAANLAAEIELARLEKVNEIASLIAEHYKGSKLARVALNIENGRLAQISFETADKLPMAAIADVSRKMTIESVFTAAILWLDKLGQQRKKPVKDLLIVCEKRPAKNAQKLHALLAGYWKNKIAILEIDRKPEPARLIELSKRSIRELWRQRSKRFRLPDQPVISETAQQIIDLAPAEIDIVYSRQGETLRFHGLPFARVRVMLGKETAWFRAGRERIMLDENFDDLVALIDLLRMNRYVDAPNRRHRLYKAMPEAWLESILRRNIKLLDANLILSPIYNQFRSSNDKIDLLALRRDGRLVVIELKTQPDREMVFQAADYWRKIELQRRRGDLAAANLFEGREILDKPTLIYLVAPAWSFHRDFEFFARSISPDIELWRFELHEDWRREVKVIARHNYAGA